MSHRKFNYLSEPLYLIFHSSNFLVRNSRLSVCCGFSHNGQSSPALNPDNCARRDFLNLEIHLISKYNHRDFVSVANWETSQSVFHKFTELLVNSNAAFSQRHKREAFGLFAFNFCDIDQVVKTNSCILSGLPIDPDNISLFFLFIRGPGGNSRDALARYFYNVAWLN